VRDVVDGVEITDRGWQTGATARLAVTTDDTASGTNTTARKTLTPLSFRFSRAATTRLMSTVGTTVPIV